MLALENFNKKLAQLFQILWKTFEKIVKLIDLISLVDWPFRHLLNECDYTIYENLTLVQHWIFDNFEDLLRFHHRRRHHCCHQGFDFD